KPAVGIAANLMVSTTPYKSNPIFGCHVNMENESFYERFRCSVIFKLRYIQYFIKVVNDLNTQRAKVGVDSHWNFGGRISNILILLDNFFGFEIPSAESPLHQEIGPIMSDVYPSLTPALDSFISTHPRTLYFAIGTVVVTTPQNIAVILKSFLELIDQDVIDGVIWSTVKIDASELLSLNNSGIPIHGGASSSHESMYNAKPMLVLPIMGDQYGNAEKLEAAGIALRLSKTSLDVNDIVLKVKRLAAIPTAGLPNFQARS
ncbi:616_t:CDS:2, partial [Racocetra persica]